MIQLVTSFYGNFLRYLEKIGGQFGVLLTPNWKNKPNNQQIWGNIMYCLVQLVFEGLVCFLCRVFVKRYQQKS